MTRMIVIESCSDCSSKDHRGGFGRVSYVPYCRKTDKDLPHIVCAGRRMVSATYTGEIPDWCPLPKAPEGI